MEIGSSTGPSRSSIRRITSQSSTASRGPEKTASLPRAIDTPIGVELVEELHHRLVRRGAPVMQILGMQLSQAQLDAGDREVVEADEVLVEGRAAQPGLVAHGRHRDVPRIALVELHPQRLDELAATAFSTDVDVSLGHRVDPRTNSAL
jgi:hypothetical protein